MITQQNLFFFPFYFLLFMYLLTIKYPKGWIWSLIEGGLNSVWVTSQLLCGTAAVAKEAGSTLEEAWMFGTKTGPQDM